jgi:UPF0716 protein FxsA
MRFLFLLFIAVPIIEITVLIQVGQMIGVWWTIALVMLTAFIGINMLRAQGMATLNRANWRMQSGQIPAQEMVEGIFLAIGGALLLTPGFVTDAFGFMCLLPFTRSWMAKGLKARIAVMGANSFRQGGSFGGGSFGAGPFGPGAQQDSTIIEGEFESREDTPDRDKIQ